ncbi:MAG: dCTP deaminase [Anaerolineae bacterium]
MGLKPDTWIRRMALEHDLIDPFIDGQVRNGVISYGLSSYGYDIRVADEFKVFTPGMGDLSVVDPKHLATRAMVDFQGDVCIIPPNSFALARSLEYIRMPRDVLGTVLGKSTYARCGVVTNFTPLEPGWHGHITIEISNTTPLPAKIYANEGIAQVLFVEGDAPCEVSYADKHGKYQGQKGVVLPRL